MQQLIHHHEEVLMEYCLFFYRRTPAVILAIATCLLRPNARAIMPSLSARRAQRRMPASSGRDGVWQPEDPGKCSTFNQLDVHQYYIILQLKLALHPSNSERVGKSRYCSALPLTAFSLTYCLRITTLPTRHLCVPVSSDAPLSKYRTSQPSFSKMTGGKKIKIKRMEKSALKL